MTILHSHTPLLESLPLNKLTGKNIYLKMDALQPPGSYKIRGSGRICSYYAEEGAKKFVCTSGGNAGLAAAYAGRKLGIPVTVVVPKSSNIWIRDKLKLEGAEVIIHGENWHEADPLTQKMAEEENTFYIPSFDHPLLWEGIASIMYEVSADGVKPDVVLLCVGGGGLLCGVVRGLQDLGWRDIPVITAETEGAASFAKSVASGSLVTLDKIDTVATSLGASRVAEQALKLVDEHPIYPQVVTDTQAIHACKAFADDHRILVEPACGATLSLLYSQLPILDQYENILAIVCGGAGVNLEIVNSWSYLN